MANQITKSYNEMLKELKNKDTNLNPHSIC